MGRKSHYINQLNYKDERFLFVLKNSQHVSQEQALMMVSRSRLESYQKEGVIRKIHYIRDSLQASAYELTHSGRGFIKSHYPEFGNNFYNNAHAVRHNIALANQIIQHEGYTYLNERDLRDMLSQKINDAGELRWHYLRMLEQEKISPCDGAFINHNGEIMCIEITTGNYTSEQIAAKEAGCELLGASVSFVKQ